MPSRCGATSAAAWRDRSWARLLALAWASSQRAPLAARRRSRRPATASIRALAAASCDSSCDALLLLSDVLAALDLRRLGERAGLAGARRRAALLRHLGCDLVVPRAARRDQRPGPRRGARHGQNGGRGLARTCPGRRRRARPLRAATFPGGLSQQGGATRSTRPPTPTEEGSSGRTARHPCADGRRRLPGRRSRGARRAGPARPRPGRSLGRAGRATTRPGRDAFGPDVMALESDDRTVSGAGSQLGWLLWADVLSPRPPAGWPSGWRVPTCSRRTASAPWPAPTRVLTEGYHRGAVWPFDNWLCWGGLRRRGTTTRPSRSVKAYDEPWAAWVTSRSCTPSRRTGSCATSRSPTGCRPGPSER